MKLVQILFYIFILFLPYTISVNAASIEAPDATLPGVHKVISNEYRQPATLDPEIMADKITEVWAKIFYPEDIKTFSEKLPLIILLHGQHLTCGIGSNPRRDNNNDYADTGVCPSGYVVVPNHEGYNYLAENLASWGYLVVSINTNRGINSSEWSADKNLARSKMLLKHLSLLYEWSTKGNAPLSIGLGKNGLIDKIDFSNVGLLGHSNGGQGVRFANYLYREPNSIWAQRIPGMKIKGIFEIAGADFPIEYPNEDDQLFINADETSWTQLLPMCDGEIPELAGRMPFERMIANFNESQSTQKSLYQVWGANHDFFNTEWQTNDNGQIECPHPKNSVAPKMIFNPASSGSVEQQTIALASVGAFFRGHVGQHADPLFNRNFNPFFTLPKKVTAITQVNRDFVISTAATEMFIIDNFDKETGINSSGNQNIANGIQIKHQSIDINYEEEHRTTQQTAVISWLKSGLNVFFESVIAPDKQGMNVSEFATLDFRIARTDTKHNPDPNTDFSIQLEDANGFFSNAIPVSEFAIINGPIAYSYSYSDDEIPIKKGYYVPVLQTIRIPLNVFHGIDISKIHGVRFIFNKTGIGSIYLTNIRFNRSIEK